MAMTRSTATGRQFASRTPAPDFNNRPDNRGWILPPPAVAGLVCGDHGQGEKRGRPWTPKRPRSDRGQDSSDGPRRFLRWATCLHPTPAAVMALAPAGHVAPAKTIHRDVGHASARQGSLRLSWHVFCPPTGVMSLETGSAGLTPNRSCSYARARCPPPAACHMQLNAGTTQCGVCSHG